MHPNSTKIRSEVEESYSRVLTDCGKFSDRSGLLMLRGKDSADFLNRLSTNDILSLSPGDVRGTVLTTEKGKVIDAIMVIHPGDHLLITTSPGNESRVKEWLEKYIIMDDVQIADVTRDFTITSVVGHRATSLLEAISKRNFLPEEKRLGSGTIDGHPAFVYKDERWSLPKYQLVAADKGSGSAEKEIDAARIGGILIEMLRIEQGIPEYGKEITDQVNPLESGLTNLVSFTKGCYIGQEVIARIDSYKKLQKRLVGVLLSDDPTSPLSPGILIENGQQVGWTTSHTWSVGLRQNIALGLLKTSTEQETIEFRSKDGSTVLPARVVNLPFLSYHAN